MKKIKLLLIALLAGAILAGCESTNVTDKLAENGIGIEKGNNGSDNYVYKKYEELENGKVYKWLNETKGTEPKFSNNMYGFYLFETENGEIKNNYPSAIFWISDSVKNILDLYGKEEKWSGFYEMKQNIGLEETNHHDGAFGWSTYDNKINQHVSHRMYTYSFQRKPSVVVKENKVKQPPVEKKIPSEEELASRGIDLIVGGDGTKYLIYSKMNDAEKGKRYMCLSWHRGFKKLPDDDGFYNVFLHEVVEQTDEDSVKVNGSYVRFYPSLTIRISIDAVKFGDIIVFDSMNTLFGKNWLTVVKPWENWGYSTIDSVLGVEVHHRYKNCFAMVEKSVVEEKGIKFEFINGKGIVTGVYPEENDLENGKRYMCLNLNKQLKPELNNDGYYVVCLHEVVDKNEPRAYNVASKFVKPYPSALLWVQNTADLKIPDEIAFDKLDTMFNKNWKILGPFGNQGWGTFDSDVNLKVEHKYKGYQLDAK